MGLLKKITRPISRVLDKIVPNEIKPALPFLSAALPFFGPAQGIMGTGIKRLLMGGGANLLAQLSQEGNEGEVNPLSLGLATLTAGMTDPGAASYLQGLKTPAGSTKDMFLDKVISPPELTGLQRFKNQALDLGITGVEKLQNLQEAVGAKGILSMEGAKLASIPATQGAMDLGIAETRRFNKQQAIDDALAAAEGLADDADRALAIRQFMEAAGYFSEDEIVDTITAAGYKAGGRVGFDNGGDVVIDTLRILPDTLDKISEKIAPFLGYDNLDELKIKNNPNLKNDEDPDFSGIKGAVEGVDKNMRADRAGDFFRLRDEAIQKGDDDKIKEIESDFFKEFGMVMPKMAKDGGRIGLANGGNGKLPIDPFQALVDYYLEMGASQSEAESLATNDYEKGIDAPKKKAKGGLMDLGGKEMDLRKGGFVPIGKKERADDVPARLSKNEFVMTADAVRGAGGGDINKGAKRMYETMNRLEARA